MGHEQVELFIQTLPTITSLAKLDDFYLKTLSNLGCPRVTHSYYKKQLEENRPYVHSIYTHDMDIWHHHFIEEDYENIDPVGQQARTIVTPVIWDLYTELGDANHHQHKMFTEALDYGLTTGISIPLYDEKNDVSLLVIHHQDIRQFLVKNPYHQYLLHSLGLYYHNKVTQLIQKDCTQDYHLTQRELECLILTAQNKTAAQIADQLRISIRTVGFHMENANKKLGTKNKFQSVAKAISLNILKL